MTYPKVNSFFLACFQLQLRWYNTLRVVCVYVRAYCEGGNANKCNSPYETLLSI